MTSAAGVYQVDNLLKAKLEGSLIEDHVRVVAVNTGSPSDVLIERIEF
jgi:metal-dependent HD superfamily phosphatase/phosphodiesterase